MTTSDDDGKEENHRAKLPATTAKGLSASSSVDLGAGVKVARVHGALQITVRKKSRRKQWLAIPAVTIIGVFMGLNVSKDGIPWMQVLTGGAFLWTAIAIAGAILNRAVISVDRRKISIRGPLLGFGRERLLDSDAISRIFVKKVTRAAGGTGPPVVYSLVAARKDGSQIDLVTHLDSDRQGSILEEQIVQELGID